MHHSDSEILEHLEHIFYGRVVLADMGITDTRIRLGFCLFVDRRGWSVTAFSDATGFDRKTVRKALHEWIEMGVVEKTGTSYKLTEFGVARMHSRYEEFLDKTEDTLKALHDRLRKRFEQLTQK